MQNAKLEILVFMRFLTRVTCGLLLFTFSICQAKTIDEYIYDLKIGQSQVRIQAVEALSKTGNKKYIELLTSYLQDPDKQLRLSIIKALKNLNADEKIFIENLSDTSPEVTKEIRKTLIELLSNEEILNLLKENLVKNSNPDIRRQIAILFGEAKENKAVEVLLKALKDTDSVRFAAVSSLGAILGAIGDKSVIDELADALHDPVSEIRLEAAKSLVSLKANNKIPNVLNLLEDKDPSVKAEIPSVLDGFITKETVLYFTEGLLKDKRIAVRKYSARALGKLGDKSAAPVLFEALRDKNEEVRKEILNSLEALVDNSLIFNLCFLLRRKDIHIRTYAVKTILQLKDSRAMPSLIDQLKREKNPELRGLIQKAIVEVSDNDVLDFLIRALKDKNLSVRISVINAIEKLKAKELLSELAQSLVVEKNSKLKIAILTTIKSFGDKSALPGLHSALLSEKSIEIKLAIINVLKEFQDESSIPTLFQCLKFGDEILRLESEEMLSKLSGPKSIDYFLDASKDENIVVRSYAMKVVKEFPTGKALPMLLVAVNDKDIYIRRDAVVVLGILGDKSAIPPLIKRLKDNDEEIRAEAVKSLGQMGDPGVIESIEKSLQDKSPRVRLEAVKVLSQYPDAEVIKQLQKMLKKETDVAVKEEIIDALLKFGDTSSVPALRLMLKDDEPSIRAISAKALGELGDKSVIVDLRGLFRKEFSSEVKAQAMLALAKLGDRDMIPEFFNALSDTSKEVCSAAKQSLDLLIDNSQSSLLVGNLQSEQRATRDYCIYALERLKPKETIKDLFSIIKIVKGTLRTQLMKLIESMADESNINDFYLLVDNPSVNKDIELQLWVLKNLSKFKTKRSVEYLSETIRHENTDIRIATVETLSKIGGSEAVNIISYVANNDLSMKVRNTAKEILSSIRR
ncbi:MAG: HEAT repeat domain-containing protein [Elusimicrobiota bacterium]|nr:HEAT repeat domain-containing protein [Elusimicrobiota bacterium]